MTGSGTVTTFVGDGEGGTIAGATYVQSLATNGVPGSNIADGSITNAKLADVATGTLKGRSSGGSGPPTDISTAAVKTMLEIEPVDVLGFDEAARDAVAGMLFGSSPVDLDYDDEANTITVSIPDGSIGVTKLAFNPAFQSALLAHVNDTSGAHLASAIAVQPFGGLTAAHVQGALQEILAAIGPTGIAGGAVPTKVAAEATYVVPADTQVTATLPIRVLGTVRVEGALVFARTTGGGGSSAPSAHVPTEVAPGATYVVPAKTQALAALPIKGLGTVRVDGSLVFIDPGSGS